MTHRHTPSVPRRTFLQGVALAAAGFGRRLRAQGRRFLRYHPPARPVLVPRESLAVPGRARRFQAQAVSLPTAANPDQPIRVSGMVVRTSDADDAPDRFRAVCVIEAQRRQIGNERAAGQGDVAAVEDDLGRDPARGPQADRGLDVGARPAVEGLR